jgi:hypothetical protein
MCLQLTETHLINRVVNLLILLRTRYRGLVLVAVVSVLSVCLSVVRSQDTQEPTITILIPGDDLSATIRINAEGMTSEGLERIKGLRFTYEGQDAPFVLLGDGRQGSFAEEVIQPGNCLILITSHSASVSRHRCNKSAESPLDEFAAFWYDNLSTPTSFSVLYGETRLGTCPSFITGPRSCDIDLFSDRLPPTATFTPMPTSTPDPLDSLKAKATKKNMVYVDGRQVNCASCAPFWMDKYEVTNRVFEDNQGLAEFVPSLTKDNDNKPRTEITYEEAKMFCETKMFGRLPTSEEWKTAAAVGYSLYPWGNEVPTRDDKRANYDDGDAPAELAEVDDSEYADGVSKPFGVWHLFGNASEWTFNPPTGEALDYGYSYESFVEDINAQTLHPQNRPTGYHNRAVGFRCAYDLNTLRLTLP